MLKAVSDGFGAFIGSSFREVVVKTMVGGRICFVQDK